MSDSGDDGSEGVIGRKMVFCPKLQAFDVDELIQSCDDCNDFVLYCCSCSQSRPNLKKPCHHFRLVFTDGACIQNGHRAATSGIGMAYGKNGESQQAIPVTELMDQGQKRTSQRAELLAAFHGVQFLAEADRLGAPEIKRRKKTHGPRDSEKAWIVATDSEYVVKGMTEWLPAWKVIGVLPFIGNPILRRVR